ncbi:hypothetical protein K501DRAFT_199385 [Backusella circina FSU 941]|nr:hypothetical protein K501DRAFT_199385 [Backusella circina FSU 941]
MELTPQQLHYFKRELIESEISLEWERLSRSSDLSLLLEDYDTPLLGYIFQKFVLEFPLLKQSCVDDFWSKCSLFLSEFQKTQQTRYIPQQTEGTKQKRAMRRKIKRSLTFTFSASLKTTQGKEEGIRITGSPSEGTDNQLLVSIVTVREVHEKKTLRDVSHAEFIIESEFPHQKIYVAKRHGDFRRLREELRDAYKTIDLPSVPRKSAKSSDDYREKDRVLLRAFIQQLVKKLPKCNIIHRFLREKATILSLEEERDAKRRRKSDQERLSEQDRFQKELDNRVYELDKTLRGLKKEIVQPGGLIQIFNTIKSTKVMYDLPWTLQRAFEWGRINFAYALHKQFLTTDTASENLANLKRIHNLMPYRTLSLMLKISNPMSMMKGILDLFLAQPFGGRSLFQRMIISNMSDESKITQKEIKRIQAEINDKKLCEKLYNAVRTPCDVEFTDDNEALLAILGNDDIQPPLSAEQLCLIRHIKEPIVYENASEVKQAFKLVKRLNQLWSLYAKQYEQQLMMDLVFQGVTGELLKEFISVFYQPLAKVYKAADISSTIRHVSVFIDDLLKVIEMCNEGQTDSIQLFIELVQRHEQQFYEFVHNVHSQEASHVFDDLIGYVDLLLTSFSQGIPGKMDLNKCIANAGIEPTDFSELEKEIDAVCQYHYKQKLYRYERTKRKLSSQPTQEEMIQVVDDSEQEQIFTYLPKGPDFHSVMADFEEFQYDEEEEDSDSDDSLAQSRKSSDSSDISYSGIERPVLKLIPKIVPMFVKEIKPLLNCK